MVAKKHWVRREMAKIDALTSVANPKGPMLHDAERLWVQFQEDFRDAVTDTTRQQLEDAERLWSESTSKRKII
jgi:hypothetical protein